MASGGHRISNASQPSAAFLLKCAKEKEKLRFRLQKQLQKHILNALQCGTFADLDIRLCSAVGVETIHNSELRSTSNEHLVKAHSGILKIRVPTFYNELLKSTVNADSKENEVVNSSLRLKDLETFLRKVYTDDDIRKHECDVLRLQKTSERDVTECNSAPKKESKLELQFTECSSKFEAGNGAEFNGCKNGICEPLIEQIVNEDSYLNEKLGFGIQSKDKDKEEESGDSLESTYNNNKQIPKHLDILPPFMSETQQFEKMNSNLGKLSKKNDPLSPALSEIDSKTDDTPSPLSTSSLVRSSTFDLQCPLALEKVLDAEDPDPQNTQSIDDHEESDNSSAWNISSQQQVCGYKEMMLNTAREIQQCIAGNPQKENPVQSFFLHQRQQETDHAIHASTSDGSLADSGILSQSLFSDTDVVAASLPSSLVNSFEGGHSVVISTGCVVNDPEENHLENEKNTEPRSPTCMFPMYIEVPVRNLSPPNTTDTNGNVPPKELYSNSTLGCGSPKTMDLIAELPPENTDQTINNLEAKEASIPKRPQSCYMFIDLDTVATEEAALAKKKQQEQSQNKRIQSLSMFIDFTKDNKEVVSQAQKQYKQFATNRSVSAVGTRELRKSSFEEIPDLIQNKTCEEGVFRKRRGSMNFGESKNGTYVDGEDFNLNKRVSPSKPKSSDEVNNCNLESRKLNNNISSHGPMTLVKNIYSANEKNEFNNGNKEYIPEVNKASLSEDAVKSSPRKDKSMKSGGIDEDGLLPMSPIMRRKVVKKEKPKVEQPEVQVKASTKPQDIDAMTFRHSLTDAEVLGSTEEVLVLIQDKNNSSLTLVPAVSSSEDNSFTVTVYDSEAKLDQPPDSHVNSPDLSNNSEREENQTEVKTLGWSDSLERQTSKPSSASYEAEDDSETVYSEVSDVSSTVLQAIGGQGNVTFGSCPSPHNQGHSPEDGREGGHGSYGSIRIRALEACSKLGEDLLRMFLEEISWDIIVQVDGREIKAHKCILVSRCKYFATMLNGDWSESSGNKINLQGFSYPVVHFALCHIYSGAINLPKDLAVPELALLADMLVLDTLKDVIVFYLKMNHCHFFHKPCSHCLVGVVECLPISVQCSLKELHNKTVKWIGKHFIRVWPTKAFAGLPEDLREQCYQQTLLNMSVETVIDITLSCDRLMSTVPHVKWAEPVFGLVTRLLEDCIHFMAGKFDQVLASDGFMALGKSQSWNVAALEDSVLSSVELVNPDSACRTFIQLGRLIPMTQGSDAGLFSSSNISPIEHGDWTQNFLDLLHRIQRHCERYLIHNANKVVHCQSWALLAPEVQKKIKDAAVIVFEFEKPTAPPPRLTSLQRKQKNPEDKSLTFPRKAQVVRGKKTSKSFRERPSDKETEVKRPLALEGEAKAGSHSLLLQEANSSKGLLEKEMAIPRISRRRASEGYYKMDHLQRSYEEEDEDDEENSNTADISQQTSDHPTQDHLPSPPKHESINLEESLPPPPTAEECLLQDDFGDVEKDGNSKSSGEIMSPIEPPTKPPRRSVIVESSYDVVKEPKPVVHRDKSRSPRREPPLPPSSLSVAGSAIPLPVPRSPTSSVRSVPVYTVSSHYSKPSSKSIVKAELGVAKNASSQNILSKASTSFEPDNDEDEDDSSGYEKVWVGVTGAPYPKENSISPTPTDLVAEIDEDTMLVNSCLHEAEALELAIAKKMQSKQHKLEKMINSSTYSVSHHHHHHHHHAPKQIDESHNVSSPVPPKKRITPISEAKVRSSDSKLVSSSSQAGTRNSVKRNVEPHRVKRPSSKTVEPGSVSSTSVTSAKTKMTNDNATSQADLKSTKNHNVGASMLPSRSKMSSSSGPSTALPAPPSGQREKPKSSKK